MAIEFFFSKKYSENGAPIRTPVSSDYFALSRVVLPNPPYLLGFRTYISTLEQLKNYTISEIRNNLGNFHVDSTLTGNGTENSPLGINDQYLDGIYYKTKNWPMTQVGDPSDFTLPLSGSYLSVSYPYTNDPYPPTAIVEGNEDLRILHHVTNGEDFRVVYATWKNYRNTPIDTMQITDTIYHPPGLASNEFIHNVFPASDSAMIGEIHNAAGFVEYCFIKTNDTAIADYHEFIRLGVQPITTFINDRGYSQNTAIQVLRAATFMAAIVKGKYYVGLIMPVFAGQPQVAFAFAEVSEAGVMTRITGWTTTNTEGQVLYDEQLAVLYQNVQTYDPADPTGCFLLNSPDLTCVSTDRTTSTSPFNRSAWTSTGDNRMIVVSHHYCQVSSPYGNAGAHGEYYHIVNFDARTVTPVPGRATGRSQFNLVGSSIGYVGGTMPDRNHYWARGRFSQPLPNGDRAYHAVAATSQDVLHETHIYFTTGARNGLGTGIDANFSSSVYRILDPIPPTAVYSGRQGNIVYNYLVQINANYIQDYGNSGNWALLQGSDTAKTYNLLSANSFAAKVPINGYALNNTRGSLDGRFLLNINSFVKGGVAYYHNAMFSAFTNLSNLFVAKIDGNLQPSGTYNCDPAVYATMENFISNTPLLDGYTHVEMTDWLVVPPYPGIGFDYAMYKVLISWRVADSSNALGYRWSGIHQICGIAPATYTRDSLDNYVLTSIDMSSVVRNWVMTTTTYLWNRQRSHVRGATAWDIGADRFYGIIRGGPASVRSHFGSNHDGWRQQAFSCNLDGSDNVFRANGPGYTEQPVVHPYHGIGVVTPSTGLGTFYSFIPMTKPDMSLDSANTSIRILGTARPAAGFNYTVTAPFDVYIDGKSFTIPVQTVDLTTISSSYQNTTFYVYAQMFNGAAKLVTSKSKLEEHMYLIYLGNITTTATEIDVINCRPVTRWETSRVSIEPIGNAIAASIGTAGSNVSTVWGNAVPLNISGAEYLWDSDDIVDTDPNTVKKDIVINITSAWEGTNVTDQGYYIKRGFMVSNYIRGLGLAISDVASLTVNVASNVALIGGYRNECNYGIDFGDELVGIPKVLNVDGRIFGAGGSRYTRLNGWAAIKSTVADTATLQIALNASGWICGGGGAGEGRVNQGYAYAGGGAPYGRGYAGGGDATMTIGGPQNNVIGNDGGNVGRPGSGNTSGQPGPNIDAWGYQWINQAGRLGP